MSSLPKPSVADAWGHVPEQMPDFSAYREDARIVATAREMQFEQLALPALLRIIDRRVAELMNDAEPIIG